MQQNLSKRGRAVTAMCLPARLPKCNLATGTDAPLGSPSGGAGCPLRGRLRGPHGLISGAITLLRYPLSQPDGCQLSQRESQEGHCRICPPNYNLRISCLKPMPDMKHGAAFAAPWGESCGLRAGNNRSCLPARRFSCLPCSRGSPDSRSWRSRAGR